MAKTLKIALIFAVFTICVFYFMQFGPNDSDRKQLEYLNKIPVPSYMTADYSDVEDGCDFKCGNPGKVEISYSSSTNYKKAMQDLSASLKSIGYKEGRSEVDSEFKLSDYEFTHIDIENNCEQILIHQYHDLHRLEFSCYLQRVNIGF